VFDMREDVWATGDAIDNRMDKRIDDDMTKISQKPSKASLEPRAFPIHSGQRFNPVVHKIDNILVMHPVGPIMPDVQNAVGDNIRQIGIIRPGSAHNDEVIVHF